MGTPHRNPVGAPVAGCADEATCTVFSCEVCLKEIPADTVNVADAQDYFHHFCGLECFEIWWKRAREHQQAAPARRPDRVK
ncbi:MAG: DUF3330 domain-containing protein [Betaproteobacteria bacterium]|nr:DUF3330 domain-containing protein [Betaproteobacteria bacterium]